MSVDAQPSYSATQITVTFMGSADLIYKQVYEKTGTNTESTTQSDRHIKLSVATNSHALFTILHKLPTKCLVFV